MRRHWARGLAVMLLAPSVRADPKSPCAGPRITLDPALRDQPQWAIAVQKTRRIVGERDVDTCASFDVSERSAGPVVRAELPDGRVAERPLVGPDELPKTVTALILLPPSSSIEGPAPAPPEPPPQLPDRATKREPTPPASRTRLPSSSRFELGLGPAGRVGYDAKIFPAIGASSFAQVHVDGWLVGVAGRASQATGRSGAVFPDWSAERSFAAGLLLGRRFVAQSFELDALLEVPTFAFERISYTTVSIRRTEDDDPGAVRTTTQDQTLTYTSVSAGLVLRASLPFSPLLRGYAALDADRTLTRFGVHDTSGGASPSLPLWGAGLSIGLRWNVL